MPTQTIKDVLDRLLSAQLKNPELLSRLSRDRLDAIARTVTHNPRSSKALEPASRSEHILKRLGHISVNPSDPLNTQAITGSYAYSNPRSTASDISDAQCVNENEGVTDEFVQLLIGEAERQHFIATQLASGVSEAVNASPRMFVLHGPRGVGKTFFLNFSLSRWSSALDERKILWVRLDLVKNFPPTNDLIKWIYAQTTKVVLRYYDSRSSFYSKGALDVSTLPVDEEVTNYIQALPGDLPHSEMTAWVRMKEVFWGQAAEQPLSERLVSEHIARHLFHYLLNHGFKFIIILDGFDKLESTHDSSSKFQSMLHAVLDLGGSTEPIGFPLVVVMRTNTLRSMTVGTTYRRFPASQTFALESPELIEIIEKRVAYLTKEVGEMATAKGWATNDWPTHLELFIEFLKSSDDGRNYLDTLNNVFSSNRRAQLQVLQLAYFDYIGSLQQARLISDKQYRLVEAMCKVGYRYPPSHYHYVTRRGKIERDIGDDLGLDNRFLPSLFSYPVVRNPDENDFEYTDFDVLLFLRIAQFIRSHDRAESIGDEQDLAAYEVMNMMQWMFGYDPELVRKLIAELIEFEVIFAYGEFSDFERDLSGMRIGSLPKMNYILERYLNDIAYLSLSLMRAPIGAVRPASQATLAQFVTISHADEGGDLEHWITTKCLNAVSAYRLMRELNRIQRVRFEQNVPSIQARKRRYPSLLETFIASRPFEFDQRMRGALNKELAALLTAPIGGGGQNEAPIEIPKIRQAIEDYQAAWC